MHRTFMLVCAVGVVFAAPARAEEPVVYPVRGQSAQQQERDQYECHEWATKETGVDPLALAEQKLSTTPTPGSKGHGAAGSAGVGAIRGATEGDAAAGAARGFGIGRMISVLRAKKQLREHQSADAQESTALHDQLDKYDRAYGACLTGRGYTVK